MLQKYVPQHILNNFALHVEYLVTVLICVGYKYLTSFFISAAASCEELFCGHKRKCFIKDGKPLCVSNTKICSAWDDSYYRTFDGEDFVLQGNCNYTLVQTTCPGLNASIPLQVNIARAYLKSATVSTIHTVQISIQGFNISIVKDDKTYVRVSVPKLFKSKIHTL